MAYKNILCPMCRTVFNIGSDTLRDRKTETRCDAIYKEHFNLQCPKCYSQVLFTAQYEMSYATVKSPRADGTIVFGVYPEINGEIDKDLWTELPKEVY